jgi:hypothetical protein
LTGNELIRFARSLGLKAHAVGVRMELVTCVNLPRPMCYAGGMNMVYGTDLYVQVVPAAVEVVSPPLSGLVTNVSVLTSGFVSPSAQRPAPSAQRPAPSAQRPAPSAQRIRWQLCVKVPPFWSFFSVFFIRGVVPRGWSFSFDFLVSGSHGTLENSIALVGSGIPFDASGCQYCFVSWQYYQQHQRLWRWKVVCFALDEMGKAFRSGRLHTAKTGDSL